MFAGVLMIHPPNCTAVPTIFDLIATTLAGIGLLWTSVSVYQMLRGALMMFGALFSVEVDPVVKLIW